MKSRALFIGFIQDVKAVIERLNHVVREAIVRLGVNSRYCAVRSATGQFGSVDQTWENSYVVQSFG